MRFVLLFLTLGLAIALAAPATAQQRDPDRVIKKRDKDGDGQLSRKEWPGSPNIFRSADKNEDGYLDVAELRALWSGKPQQDGGGQRVVALGQTATGRCRNSIGNARERDGMIVDVLAPDCVYAGTTLFGWNAEPSNPMIREVDMRGRIVWELAIRDVLPSSLFQILGGDGWARDKAVSVMDVAALPSGNILFNVRQVGGFEVTRDGGLVWQHLDPEMSHDLDRLPNGNTIYARGWAGRGEDHVREVTPGGRTVWSWNGLADYDRKPFRDVDIEGWMHVNGVTRTRDGRTFVSIRNFDRTAEVGPDGRVVSETVYCRQLRDRRPKTARNAMGLAHCRPHDPEVLRSGHILVALPSLNRVAVQRIGSERAARVLGRSREEGFWSIRDVNRLPNGNLLITGYDRIVEVTGQGAVVWQLRVPDRPAMASQASGERLRGTEKEDLFKAQRIGPDGRGHGG